MQGQGILKAAHETEGCHAERRLYRSAPSYRTGVLRSGDIHGDVEKALKRICSGRRLGLHAQVGQPGHVGSSLGED